MTEASYVWAIARLLMESLGGEAALHAERRAHENMASGQVIEADTWQRVHGAIVELRRQAHPGDVIH